MARIPSIRQKPIPTFLIRLRANKETTSSVGADPEADWVEKTVGGVKSAVLRVRDVFMDYAHLLWNPQKLLDSVDVQRDRSVRPLMFFVLVVPLAALIMYLERIRAALTSSWAPPGRVSGGETWLQNLLLGPYDTALDLIESPEHSLKLLLPTFLIGVVINEAVAAFAKQRRRAWQAAALYAPAAALLTMILAIELVVLGKSLIAPYLPSAWVGEPYRLSSVTLTLIMLLVTGLCARILYAAYPSPKRWNQTVAHYVVAYGVLALAAVALGLIDRLEQSLGDPTQPYAGKFDASSKNMLDLVAQKPLALSLTNHTHHPMQIVPDSLRFHLSYDMPSHCPQLASSENGSHAKSSCQILLQVLNSDEKDWINIPAGETRLLRIKSKQPMQYSDPITATGFRCLSVQMDLVEDGADVETVSSRLVLHFNSTTDLVKYASSCERPI